VGQRAGECIELGWRYIGDQSSQSIDESSVDAGQEPVADGSKRQILAAPIGDCRAPLDPAGCSQGGDQL
jgi:hypothetical protein